MKKIAATLGCLFVLWAALSIFPTVAQNPQFPQTLPANTVVGRTGIVAGPAQAIPFTILTGNLLLAISGDCAVTISGVITCTINDTSAVAGSGASKWKPLFSANPGTGRVSRFNRVFVGEATASSSDFGPVTTKDWLETLVPNTIGAAMFASVDTTGNLGIVGASRCSDFRTVFGSSSGGCQGGTFYGYNDDTTGGAIACGSCSTTIRKSGAIGISVNQWDAVNGGSVVDVLPFSAGIPNGTVIAALMTAGAVTPPGFTNANISAAWVVGAGSTTRHRKGGVCQNGALDTSVGGGTNGVCLEMARNQSIRWLNSTPTTDSEIWGNASGLNISSPIVSGINGGSGGSLTLNGATSSSGSISVSATAGTLTINTATINSSGGIVTGVGGLAVNGSLGTQTPTTLTGTSGTITNTSTIINSSGAFTATLPAASGFAGQWLYILNIAANAVNSASSNVTPRTSTTAGTAIISATAGGWVSLQSDGTNWRTMAGTP